MKQNRMHIPAMTDHVAAARKVRAAEGAWVMVSVYRSSQGGDAIARSIRAGRITAYQPTGAFDAYAAMHTDGTAVWARSLSDSWVVVPMPTALSVRVPDYGTQRGYEGVTIRTVSISPTCPSCGGPRGTVRPHSFVKDGARLVCDVWTNECGHMDEYRDVLAEARRIAGRIREPKPKGPRVESVPGGQYAAAVDLLAEELKERPYLKGEAAAQLLDQEGHTAAAAAVREFIQSSPTRWHTSAKACALFLIDQDAAQVDGKGESK